MGKREYDEWPSGWGCVAVIAAALLAGVLGYVLKGGL